MKVGRGEGVCEGRKGEGGYEGVRCEGRKCEGRKGWV